MSEALIDLVLARLNRIDENVERIGDVKNRLSSIEAGQASIIQHLGHLAAADAQQQLTADRVLDRLSRLEQRLDLRDA